MRFCYRRAQRCAAQARRRQRGRDRGAGAARFAQGAGPRGRAHARRCGGRDAGRAAAGARTRPLRRLCGAPVAHAQGAHCPCAPAPRRLCSARPLVSHGAGALPLGCRWRSGCWRWSWRPRCCRRCRARTPPRRPSRRRPRPARRAGCARGVTCERCKSAPHTGSAARHHLHCIHVLQVTLQLSASMFLIESRTSRAHNGAQVGGPGSRQRLRRPRPRPRLPPRRTARRPPTPSRTRARTPRGWRRRDPPLQGWGRAPRAARRGAPSAWPCWCSAARTRRRASAPRYARPTCAASLGRSPLTVAAAVCMLACDGGRLAARAQALSCLAGVAGAWAERAAYDPELALFRQARSGAREALGPVWRDVQGAAAQPRRRTQVGPCCAVLPSGSASGARSTDAAAVVQPRTRGGWKHQPLFEVVGARRGRYARRHRRRGTRCARPCAPGSLAPCQPGSAPSACGRGAAAGACAGAPRAHGGRLHRHARHHVPADAVAGAPRRPGRDAAGGRVGRGAGPWRLGGRLARARQRRQRRRRRAVRRAEARRRPAPRGAGECGRGGCGRPAAGPGARRGKGRIGRASRRALPTRVMCAAQSHRRPWLPYVRKHASAHTFAAVSSGAAARAGTRLPRSRCTPLLRGRREACPGRCQSA